MTRRAANPGQRPFMVSGDSMKRIAAAVQSYEHGNRKQAPVRFRQAGDDGGSDGGGEPLKLCKTASDWDVNTIATLNVWHDGTPPDEADTSDETVQAVNKMAPVRANTFVLVGKAGNGSWYLVEIGRGCLNGMHATQICEDGLSEGAGGNFVVGEGPQVLIHTAGCLQWASLAKQRVITDAELTEDGLQFTVKEIWCFPDGGDPASPVLISTTECPPPE